jgi:Immunoglobulin-like domain of bacterial spore germination/Sporulation and spore germination
MRRVPLAVVVVVALAGCGEGRQTAPAESSPATTATTSETTTEAAPATSSVAVYFVRDGKVAPVRRRVPATKAVGAAALAELLAGPDASERADRLASAIPAGTSLGGLSIAAGDAKLDGTDGLDRAALGEIVYTLTQFPTVHSVNGLTRADLEDVTPIILVESPLPGDTVSSPLHVRGTADTFEANVQLSVSDADGTLVDTFTTATSGNGQRGTFDATVTFTVRQPGPGTVLAFDVNQGSGVREHVVTIPVQLR